jgi:hypothetical protein
MTEILVGGIVGGVVLVGGIGVAVGVSIANR